MPPVTIKDFVALAPLIPDAKEFLELEKALDGLRERGKDLHGELRNYAAWTNSPLAAMLSELILALQALLGAYRYQDKEAYNDAIVSTSNFLKRLKDFFGNLQKEGSKRDVEEYKKELFDLLVDFTHPLISCAIKEKGLPTSDYERLGTVMNQVAKLLDTKDVQIKKNITQNIESLRVLLKTLLTKYPELLEDDEIAIAALNSVGKSNPTVINAFLRQVTR